MTNKLGPRPTNPADISFDRSCFVQVGTRTEYRVPAVRGSTGYPARLDSRQAAEELARVRRVAVSVVEVPVWLRVSWR